MKKLICVICVLALLNITPFFCGAEEALDFSTSLATIRPGTGSAYARTLQLANGTLFCAYDYAGKIWVTHSRNGGRTWQKHILVTGDYIAPTTKDKLGCSNANALQLPDGSLLCAYRCHTSSSVTGNPRFYTSIRINRSTDGGYTWKPWKTVEESTGNDIRSISGGFWEPEMRILPDGRLGVYYASDAVNGDCYGFPYVSLKNYQHIILQIYDEQQGEFGDPIIASNGEKHRSRDGMPVVCELSDKTLAMVIEASSDSLHQLVIRILFSKNGLSWTDPVTIAVPPEVGVNRSNYRGAPYIVCLPDGRIAVSYQTNCKTGTTISSTTTYNCSAEVIVSKTPVTYESRNTIGPASFTEPVRPLPYVTNGFSIWISLFCYDSYLYFFCASGVSTSADTRSYRGLQIKRAYVGGNYLRGDANCDGKVDNADAVAMMSVASGASNHYVSLSNCDFDKNGKIDNGDTAVLLTELSH